MSYSFYKERKEWSEIKHRLLAKYLVPYCYKLGSWNKEIFYIDGFAGKGKYEDGARGSPLIAAYQAKAFRTQGRKFTLKCINIECQKSYCDELRQHTLELEKEGLVFNKHSKFENSICYIIDKINDFPAFFFIDPFGLAPIKFDLLKPIFERKVSTELLMNFSLIGLRRLAGNIDALTLTERARKSAETKVSVLSQVLNTNEWITLWNNEPNRKDRELRTLSLYENNLNKYFNYVFSYPIRKNIKSYPKYYLIFASNHRDAMELMNDFIYDEEQQLKNARGMKDMFEAEEITQLFKEIKKDIYCLGIQSKRTTREKIRAELIPKRFGLLKKKDYDHAVKELDQEGLIIRSSVKAIQDNELLEFVTNSQEAK